MPICGFDFHKQERPPSSEACAQAWKPYLLHCIESFGPSRCMFESNFPVDKRSCSYTVLWNAFKRVAEGFSDSEKADLFCDTAVRTYRL
jgi:predicted TIM-barrel fold metal-dependent hydrolase